MTQHRASRTGLAESCWLFEPLSLAACLLSPCVYSARNSVCRHVFFLVQLQFQLQLKVLYWPDNEVFALPEYSKDKECKE